MLSVLQFARIVSLTFLPLVCIFIFFPKASSAQEFKDPTHLSSHCRILSGHKGTVSCLSYSPDGSTLASGSVDGFIYLWELSTGKIKRQFQAHLGGVCCVAFSPDGKKLVSAGTDDVIEVDRSRGKVNVIPGGHRVKIWNPDSGKSIANLEGHEGQVVVAAFSPDGNTVATGSYDRTIRLWESESAREIVQLRGHLGRVTSLAFSPDGKALCSGGLFRWAVNPNLEVCQCDQIHVWDLVAKVLIRKLSIRASHVHYSSDGTLAAGGMLATFRQAQNHLQVGGRYSAHLVNPTCDSESFNIGGRGQFIAFAPNGRLFVTGHGSMSRHADGNLIGASDPGDTNLTLWVRQTGKPIFAFSEKSIGTLVFAPNGKQFVVTSLSGVNLQLWDLEAVLLDWAKSSTKSFGHDLDTLWGRLSHEDPASAYKALWRMAVARKEAVDFLRERISPVSHKSGRHVTNLLAKLNAERFMVRDEAVQELKRLGFLFEPELRRALANAHDPEERRQLEAILSQVEREIPAPIHLRELRAIQVLENIGTVDAQQVLKELANGAPGATLSMESQAALRRINRSP